MTMCKIPRIMLAGTNSGCGKTTVVCGILSALKQKGIKSVSCKCGPDYIDPMFHSRIFGIPSQNLDLFFSTEQQVNYLMCRNGEGADIAVMEGVMGFYDGMEMNSPKASSYDLAKVTKTPVILVVNGKGMAFSVVALIKGFLEFTEDNTICGVILNGVSEMTGRSLKTVIEESLPVKVYGCVPNIEEFTIPSRHLGLVTPLEIDDIYKDIEKLGELMEKYVDLQAIMELADTAPFVDKSVPSEWEKYEKIWNNNLKKLKIAVAFDKAFCFYYRDNLNLLERLGCELVFFSPLKDPQLPLEADAIIIGGGYPEVYAQELSKNETMLRSIRKKAEENIPIMAECGGFMYLHSGIEDESGKMWNMADVISGSCKNQHKLVRFGYINVKAERENGFLLEKENIKAHEFHYWDSTNNGDMFIAEKPSGKRKWKCCHCKGNIIAGYPHLYYYSNIEMVLRFLKKAEEYSMLKEG